MREADDRRLGDRLVGDERALDLGGAQPVSRDVDDVVDPAEQPEVAVVVHARAVTGEVAPREALEVHLAHPRVLGVAPRTAQHAGPRALDDEVAALVDRRVAAVLRTTSGTTPKNGTVAEPGLSGIAPGSGVMTKPPVSVCQ